MSEDHYDQKMQTLINGLIERTSGKKGWYHEPITWVRAEENTFELSLTSSTIRIGSVDGDGIAPFVFRIYDENGRILEEVHEAGDGISIEYGLADLYRLASRSHRGIDKKLSEILEELNISDPSGPWGRSGPSGELPF